MARYTIYSLRYYHHKYYPYYQDIIIIKFLDLYIPNYILKRYNSIRDIINKLY
ncbi:hypothetical protein ECH_0921 [Ehrlichia chaffeensis str. Arkansas]|uniref:Uncharacterized protein n=1 Tax=Ehrlichia chaffeensis (strain ATCC CRL-10679 / Arkansas) TaxID=205920 RepID=Q2GFS2_EHRCR|nr:hypothetical protein ECH_0921 [Ehrlichia chaffeensis str. Arkansas]